MWIFYKILFGHKTLSLKFEYDTISGCWDILILIFWGCLHLKDLQNMVLSYKLKLKIWEWSSKWLLRHSTSILGHLHLKDLQNMVLSYKPKFKIWVRSNKWWLRWFIIYSTFYILRSSSVRGCLHIKDWQNMVWS